MTAPSTNTIFNQNQIDALVDAVIRYAQWRTRQAALREQKKYQRRPKRQKLEAS
jgi:hypothetical protein